MWYFVGIKPLLTCANICAEPLRTFAKIPQTAEILEIVSNLCGQRTFADIGGHCGPLRTFVPNLCGPLRTSAEIRFSSNSDTKTMCFGFRLGQKMNFRKGPQRLGANVRKAPQMSAKVRKGPQRYVVRKGTLSAKVPQFQEFQQFVEFP